MKADEILRTLTKERITQRLTKYEVSKKSRVNRNTIQAWEQVKCSQLNLLVRWTEALGYELKVVKKYEEILWSGDSLMSARIQWGFIMELQKLNTPAKNPKDWAKIVDYWWTASENALNADQNTRTS